MAHFYQGIGERIKRLREEKGYSQIELAELISMDIDMITAFESGRMRIFVDHISKLAVALGVTTDYLIYGTGGTNEQKTNFICGEGS